MKKLGLAGALFTLCMLISFTSLPDAQARSASNHAHAVHKSIATATQAQSASTTVFAMMTGRPYLLSPRLPYPCRNHQPCRMGQQNHQNQNNQGHHNQNNHQNHQNQNNHQGHHNQNNHQNHQNHQNQNNHQGHHNQNHHNNNHNHQNHHNNHNQHHQHHHHNNNNVYNTVTTTSVSLTDGVPAGVARLALPQGNFVVNASIPILFTATAASTGQVSCSLSIANGQTDNFPGATGTASATFVAAGTSTQTIPLTDSITIYHDGGFAIVLCTFTQTSGTSGVLTAIAQAGASITAYRGNNNNNNNENNNNFNSH